MALSTDIGYHLLTVSCSISNSGVTDAAITRAVTVKKLKPSNAVVVLLRTEVKMIKIIV